MGSNMQRQAVPLLITDPPIVSTGMEVDVATQLEHGDPSETSRHGFVCRRQTKIEIGSDRYDMAKFQGLNERTSLEPKADCDARRQSRKRAK